VRARASGSHAVVTKLLTDFMLRTWREAITHARELASQIYAKRVRRSALRRREPARA
jgi:hypothetical protein